jgi:nucleoid-associated protein YgaU
VIDTWRVAADGAAVVSGSSAPGATVEVVVDDVAVASGAATASGEFAILFTLAPNPKPSLMWLSVISPDTPDAAPVLSEEMVALGPVEGPKVPDATAEADDQVASAEEPSAPAALLLSDDGAVVLQDPAVLDPVAGPMATVMIDTISYTPDGEVQVGGRGAEGAMLRLYLDNAEKATVEVPQGGLWVTTLPDTLPGVYTLRVDQLDPAGKVVSRFETPFKRETLEALASVADAEPAAQEAAAATEATAPPEATETAAEAAADGTPLIATADADPEPAAQEALVTPEATADPAPQAAATPPPVTVTVQPGFTLWGIAQDRYGDGVMYVQVFEANKDKIKDPDLIYPGQVLSVPETAP